MITRLLNRVTRAIWRRHTAVPDLAAAILRPAPEDEPEWTADDRAHLLALLRSETGAKLLQLMRSREEILKTCACAADERRVDHARGKAVGYRQALAQLVILSAPPPPPSEENSADDADRGAAALRTRHSP